VQIKLPFVDQTELLTDILHHGSRVLVEAPRSLAVAVVKQLRSSLAINDVRSRLASGNQSISGSNVRENDENTKADS